MGRTVPTSHQANSALIDDLKMVKEGVKTDDKKLLRLVHTDPKPKNERAISLEVFRNALQNLMLAMHFGQCKMIVRRDPSGWQQGRSIATRPRDLIESHWSIDAGAA